MKIVTLLILAAFPLAMLSYAGHIYVMRGQLDPTWGGASIDNGACQRKYMIIDRGIGEFKTDHVFIRYSTPTLLGAEPEDAILILVPFYYDEGQKVHAFNVLGGDASIGMLNYDGALWGALTNMSNDELLAYCTPTNTVSFEEAVRIGINFLHEKIPEAKEIALAGGGGKPEESYKKLLSWLMTMRVHFSEDRYRDVVVEVNVKGKVVGYSIGF